MAMKKLKRMLKEKLGMTKTSVDEEYDHYVKNMEEYQKILTEKNRLLKSFMSYFTDMFVNLTNMTGDLIQMYTPSNGIDDPMKEYLVKIIGKTEQASKLFEETIKKVESQWIDKVFSVKKYTTPLKVEMKERDELKVTFDDSVSSMKRFLAKTKKKDPEKFLKEKERLKRSLEEYNAKNMYIKEQIILFLRENPPVSDEMLIIFCCEYARVIKKIGHLFENVQEVVKNFDTTSRRIHREKKGIHTVTSYFLEDTMEMSTIVENEIYVGSREGAKDKKILQEKRIRTIVNCSIGEFEPVKNYFPQDFKYQEVVLSENSDNTLVFDEFVNIMNNSQRPIFVHCFGGVNRSPTLLIAYFIKHERMRTKEIFPILQERRRFIRPNDFLINQLLRYEQKVFNEKGPFLEFQILPPKDSLAQRTIRLYHGGKIQSPGELEAYEEYEDGRLQHGEDYMDGEDIEEDMEGEECSSSDEDTEESSVHIPNEMTVEEMNSEIKRVEMVIKKKEDEVKNRLKWLKKEKELRNMAIRIERMQSGGVSTSSRRKTSFGGGSGLRMIMPGSGDTGSRFTKIQQQQQEEEDIYDHEPSSPFHRSPNSLKKGRFNAKPVLPGSKPHSLGPTNRSPRGGTGRARGRARGRGRGRGRGRSKFAPPAIPKKMLIHQSSESGGSGSGSSSSGIGKRHTIGRVNAIDLFSSSTPKPSTLGHKKNKWAPPSPSSPKVRPRISSGPNSPSGKEKKPAPPIPSSTRKTGGGGGNSSHIHSKNEKPAPPIPLASKRRGKGVPSRGRSRGGVPRGRSRAGSRGGVGSRSRGNFRGGSRGGSRSRGRGRGGTKSRGSRGRGRGNSRGGSSRGGRSRGRRGRGGGGQMEF